MSVSTLPSPSTAPETEPRYEWQLAPDVNDVQTAISVHRHRAHRRRSWTRRLLVAVTLTGLCVLLARGMIYVEENHLLEIYFEEAFTR